MQSHELWDFSSQKNKEHFKKIYIYIQQVENDYFVSTQKTQHTHTKFDFTVDEGKVRLNPPREKDQGRHRRRKVETSVWPYSSCVTPAGTSTSQTSRINGMTTTTCVLAANVLIPPKTFDCSGGLAAFRFFLTVPGSIK